MADGRVPSIGIAVIVRNQKPRRGVKRGMDRKGKIGLGKDENLDKWERGKGDTDMWGTTQIQFQK